MRPAQALSLLGYVAAVTVATARADAPIPRAEHPRPDLRRDDWQNLNGTWSFCFDPADRGLTEQWPLGSGPFDRRITVPFAWPSALSGIADGAGQRIGWYRRVVRVPESWRGSRVWLCFGAVDHEARVWVAGQAVGRHEGGSTPFAFDITGAAPPGSEVRVDVRVAAAPAPANTADGRQRAEFASSRGIWQTVWLESRPAAYVDGLRLTPTRPAGRWVLEAEVELAGPNGPVEVALRSPDPTVTAYRGTAEIEHGRGALRVLMEIGNPKTWSPESPHLYDLEVSATGPRGQRDVVNSYFGLRTIARGMVDGFSHERILLNGEPLFLRGAMDPSLNAEGLVTAPSDAFLRRDIELARQLGLNLLKIYGKAEEPRRMYWADKLGLLLWQEMPSANLNSAPSRDAWQSTLAGIVRRDRNHPSLIGWTLFHDWRELEGRQVHDARAMQQWVRQRVLEVKQQLDPSRLVEDTAAALADHVETDVNSWQFRIDDYWIAREHIGQVVARMQPGSPLSLAQGTAPLLCGQFVAVPPEGGDVSWALRFLTTQLRRHAAIQGHIVGSFYDVPWRRDGLRYFDRSAKEFGYDAFLPGMTIADLNRPDFIGFDAPPVIETAPGDEVTLALFASHYSDRQGPAQLRWQVVGTDDFGRRVAGSRQTRDISWVRGSVAYQTPLRVRVPEGTPFAGAIVAELLDAGGRRIAANYVNLIADWAVEIDAEGRVNQAEPLRTRVEVLAPRLVAVSFSPRDFAAIETDELDWSCVDTAGVLSAFGNCAVEYRIALPRFVRDAIPSQMVLMAEMAVRAAHAQAVPDPSARLPGSVGITLGKEELWRFSLPDDPADSRGILSHRSRFRHGNYGELVRQRVDLTSWPTLREQIYTEDSFPIVLRTEGSQIGLAVYGRELGRHLVDPTLIIQTAKQLEQPVGFISYDPVATDRLLDRCRKVDGIRMARDGGHEWRYTTDPPPSGWKEPEFDDASWAAHRWRTRAPRGPAAMPGPNIWLRADFELASRPAAMVLRYGHEEPIRVYLNGHLLVHSDGASPTERQRSLKADELRQVRPGRNTLAVEAKQTGASAGFDLGLSWMEPDAP